MTAVRTVPEPGPTVRPAGRTSGRPAVGRMPGRPAVARAGRSAGGPAAVLGQAGLLLALDRVAGLGVAGWAAGLAFGLVLAAVLAGRALGPADRVTLTRAVLAGGVTALAAESLRGAVPAAVLVPLAAVALALDAVDGRVARRTGTASAFGARFDMEVDAFLLVALGVLAVPSLGLWVLAIGAMRYAFGAAGAVVPELRGTLPPRHWRKVVAAVQGIALLAAASGLLPVPVSAVVVAAALALLLESFGRDVLWLLVLRPAR